jgi:probable rRNA maturation factor
LAEAVLKEEGLPGDAELSVLFVDESSIAELNSRFRGEEGPTDVLAFPIDEEPVESGRSPDSGGTGPGTPSEPEDVPVLLGDIVICPAVAYRNAPEHAGNYDDELALLVVHGLLHLMTMDHQDDDEADEMEARERELLSRHYADLRPETWSARTGGGGAGQGAGTQSVASGSGDQATAGAVKVGDVAFEGVPSARDGARACDGAGTSTGGANVSGAEGGSAEGTTAERTSGKGTSDGQD